LTKIGYTCVAANMWGPTLVLIACFAAEILMAPILHHGSYCALL